MKRLVWKNVGPPNTPQALKRLRRESMDFFKLLGQPIVTRHILGVPEELAGTAQRCPSCWRSSYDQPRNNCTVCYGIGYASVELSDDPDLFIDTHGNIVTGDPGTGVRAPKWAGFDEPFLTWMVEPDVAEDWFKIDSGNGGVLQQVYDAQGLAPWYPTLHDNDLCVNVTLDAGGYNVIGEDARFQLKMVQQVSIRGLGKKGRPTPDQNFLVNQTFRMNRVPHTQLSLMSVPINV